MSAPTLRAAIKHIEKRGVLLVFPMNNAPDPRSLWHEFFPRKAMRWEWNDDGDDRVADLWHLRERLSKSDQVVYTKWFRGRATFFSRAMLPYFLRAMNPWADLTRGLATDSRKLLEILESESPQSTKALKLAADMRGKFFERTYERSMKILWSRLLLVGYGEIDDGAFPSLAVGATQLLFEDLWKQAKSLDPREAALHIERAFPGQSAIGKHIRRLLRPQKV